jgi:large subunit ribosomal protein L23
MILKKPIITEKMTSQGESLGRYGFVVSKNANKIQIKKAVEEMYGVSVDTVRTMNYYGKTKFRSTKSKMIRGNSGAFKKAIVQLKKGDAIDFYSNI